MMFGIMSWMTHWAIIPFVTAPLSPVQPAGSPLQFEDSVRYEITQRITVTNHDVSRLDLLELNLPVPVNGPQQSVTELRITGDDTFVLKDVDGMGEVVRSLYNKAKVLPGPGESRSLSITYTLFREATRTHPDGLTKPSFDDYDQRHADCRPFLRPEKSIEVDDPILQKLAAELRARSDTPYVYARAAYDHVIDHVTYASPSPSHSARQCLDIGQGDCGAYALLFVALCRAGGVPARPIVGCWAQGDNPWHCWAEFLIPGVGWIPADPSVGERGERERAFYFGNLDNNRVTLAKTFNLTVDTTRGSRELGFVQVGTWWWYPAPGSPGSEMSVEHHFAGQRTSR